MKDYKKLLDDIRSDISSGRLNPGDYLPSLRKLSAEHNMCAETARKALNKLIREGLLQSSPRKGFKVKDQKASELKQIAFVTNKNPDLSDAQKATWACSNAIHKIGDDLNIPILSLHFGTNSTDSISRQLKSMNLLGLITDSNNEEFVEALLKSDLPVVMINSWIDQLPVNAVIQDNYHGGYTAAKHLIETGAKNIAWLGHEILSNHHRNRLSGVMGALLDYGLTMKPKNLIQVPPEKMKKTLTDVLSTEDRPDGIVAFDYRPTLFVKEVADDLNLKLNKDLHIVGWNVREYYKEMYQSIFEGMDTPPAITWKATDAALFAIERIIALSKNNMQPPIKINIPVRLQLNS